MTDIRITAINPSIVRVGIHPFTIEFKLKSSGFSTLNVEIELFGENQINFVENGMKIRKISVSDVPVSTTYTNQNFPTQTQLDYKSDIPKMATIVIRALNPETNEVIDQNQKSFTHD
jgi:hypothetical protein